MKGEWKGVSKNPYRGMVVTDLDGTLLHHGSSISALDRGTLERLGVLGVLRVIATGRSRFSAYKVLRPELPIDYLIFSSGAGIIDWRTQHIVQKHVMHASEVQSAATLLLNMGHDFMIHDPIPNNHRFHYFGTGENNPDFIRRLDYYRDFALMGNPSNFMFRDACQILSVVPDGVATSAYRTIARKLYGLTVIRTTSPIDAASTWIEIFPPAVSKSQAAEWIRGKVGLAESKMLAVGNDYNDLDLLTWAPHRYVVGNAVEELRKRFQPVSPSSESGFTEAVQRWMTEGL
jgi:HAD superfamily hydrolase (TIGR01484 family)